MRHGHRGGDPARARARHARGAAARGLGVRCAVGRPGDRAPGPPGRELPGPRALAPAGARRHRGGERHRRDPARADRDRGQPDRAPHDGVPPAGARARRLVRRDGVQRGPAPRLDGVRAGHHGPRGQRRGPGPDRLRRRVALDRRVRGRRDRARALGAGRRGAGMAHEVRSRGRDPDDGLAHLAPLRPRGRRGALGRPGGRGALVLGGGGHRDRHAHLVAAAGRATTADSPGGRPPPSGGPRSGIWSPTSGSTRSGR